MQYRGTNICVSENGTYVSFLGKSVDAFRTRPSCRRPASLYRWYMYPCACEPRHCVIELFSVVGCCKMNASVGCRETSVPQEHKKPQSCSFFFGSLWRRLCATCSFFSFSFVEPLIDKGAMGELDQFSAKEFHPDVSTADLLKKFETNYNTVRVETSSETSTRVHGL